MSAFTKSASDPSFNANSQLGKSGVGGGILAIGPGRASIPAWLPGLDASGNSHLGPIALEALTKRMGWSIFGP